MDGGAVKRILRIGWFKRNLLLPQLHLKRERERECKPVSDALRPFRDLLSRHDGLLG